MNRKDNTSEFEKNITPIISTLLAGNNNSPEVLRNLQAELIQINSKYSKKYHLNTYKIYYAQALIDYLSYNDELAADSLEYAKTIYGGEFEGYIELLKHLNIRKTTNKWQNIKTMLGWAIIIFCIMAWLGWILSIFDGVNDNSTGIGTLLFPLPFLVIGIYLLSNSKY